MKRLIFAFAFLATTAMAAPETDKNADEKVAARRAALDLAGAWTNDGFKLRDGHFSNMLKVGEPKFVRVNLYAGNQYWFTLAATDKAKKVAVQVFDEGGKPVEFEAHLDGARAAAGFAPKASGPYLLKLEELEGEPSAIALVYSYR
jgi:hypothetical protein